MKDTMVSCSSVKCCGRQLVGLMLLLCLLGVGQLGSAFAQPGSTGGTLGKTDKSLSGGESTEPSKPSAKSRGHNRQEHEREPPAAIAGRWRWTADCTLGHWQGEFNIYQSSRERFSGAFAGTSLDDRGTISDGHLNGNNISFIRTSSVATQHWTGQVAGGRMSGSSSGNANCSWQAIKKGQ